VSPAVAKPERARRSAIHEEALRAFAERIERDQTVVAAILLGSLAYDDVWEKSDIDMYIITDEEKAANKEYNLVERGVDIHASVFRRGDFKQQVERSLGGGWAQSILERSRLLFCKDESIRAYYDDVRHMGSRDRAYRLMSAAAGVLPSLTKAEKWLVVKGDVAYSFLWVMYTINDLAAIEVVRHGETPGREVIAQALRHNPAFFRAVYSDFIQAAKDAASVRAVIDLIHGYLDEQARDLFRPILDYLQEAGGSRTVTELNEHFRHHAQIEDLTSAYEWLADKGIIRKVAAPLRLTVKSKVYVDEAAYYYDGSEGA
jgi:predicted nucleotidyltransferase